jgi:hypothetical protein
MTNRNGTCGSGWRRRLCGRDWSSAGRRQRGQAQPMLAGRRLILGRGVLQRWRREVGEDRGGLLLEDAGFSGGSGGARNQLGGA